EKKIGNKVTSNEKNIKVVTELGKIDIMIAVQQDRLSNSMQQIRTKGRITRWKTACKKVFDSTKINPQSFKFKKGDFYYYCENNYSIVIAEIITVFEKRGSSYVHIDLLTGLNEGKIHARLYNVKSDSACEFTPIINQNRTQFICEFSSFRFVAHLGSVSEEYHRASHWLGKMIKLGDLQYATYFHFVEKS
ncbi:6553_t:CDS:2, partial [Funneliformis geosporum]